MKPIKGFEDYLITKDGRIYSNLSQKWLKLSKDKDGYLIATLYKSKRGHRFRVHRLVLETFVGTCPVNCEGCHNNGNPSDNRFENLRWDTRNSNIADTIKHGTHVDNSGENHGNSKLSISDVIDIRASNKTQTELALEYGVSQKHISRIINKECWKLI